MGEFIILVGALSLVFTGFDAMDIYESKGLKKLIARFGIGFLIIGVGILLNKVFLSGIL